MTDMKKMEEYTVEEFQDNWDALIARVENGETLVINDNGKRAVFVPSKKYDDTMELIDLYRNHNEAP